MRFFKNLRYIINDLYIHEDQDLCYGVIAHTLPHDAEHQFAMVGGCGGSGCVPPVEVWKKVPFFIWHITTLMLLKCFWPDAPQKRIINSHQAVSMHLGKSIWNAFCKVPISNAFVQKAFQMRLFQLFWNTFCWLHLKSILAQMHLKPFRQNEFERHLRWSSSVQINWL